jgi:hypothetical protein
MGGFGDITKDVIARLIQIQTIAVLEIAGAGWIAELHFWLGHTTLIVC